MADNKYGSWLGGPNFVYAPQWGSGRSNDGGQRKRQNLTKRMRFNPNPTSNGHASCVIAKQSAADKARFQREGMPKKYYRSSLLKRAA